MLLFTESGDDDDEDVGIENTMDDGSTLDSPYSDSHCNAAAAATESTTAAAATTNNGPSPSLLSVPTATSRRTSLADIISRVRRTSAGLQQSQLQPLTESKSELPHYTIPMEKFADKRVKVRRRAKQLH